MHKDMFDNRLVMAHVAMICSLCTCATKIGTNVCSNSSVRVAMACVCVFSMYNIGIDVVAMMMGMYVNAFAEILNGNVVSLYHVSACRLGCQHMDFVLHPKTMNLAAIHAHIVATSANNILIY